MYAQLHTYICMVTLLFTTFRIKVPFPSYIADIQTADQNYKGSEWTTELLKRIVIIQPFLVASAILTKENSSTSLPCT